MWRPLRLWKEKITTASTANCHAGKNRRRVGESTYQEIRIFSRGERRIDCFMDRA
jgi:hypothetical protein